MTKEEFTALKTYYMICTTHEKVIVDDILSMILDKTMKELIVDEVKGGSGE